MNWQLFIGVWLATYFGTYFWLVRQLDYLPFRPIHVLLFGLVPRAALAFGIAGGAALTAGALGGGA